MKNILQYLIPAFFLLNLFGCSSSRQSQYLQGSFDTARLSQLRIAEPVVQKGDLLSIIVYSDNPQATAIYNQPISGLSVAGTSSPSSPGYLVDSEGNIQFQGLGNIQVEGLSRRTLMDTLLNRLNVYLTNPYVTIRFLNYKITVIGDVSRPGIYTIPGDRVNILEAIGLAGEFTLYGRKDNVLVIREQNGKREFGRLDLRNPEVFTSQYYHLQQNDKVLIDQIKNKQSATDQVLARNVGLAASVISIIAIVISLILR